MSEKSLIAFEPTELRQSQDTLKQWLAEKRQLCTDEAKELRESFEAAKSHKWKSSSIGAAAKRAEHRADYYDKALKAVEAGYLLIPPFPLNVFAVRTTRNSPPSKIVSSKWNIGKVKPSNAPAGEGRYVDTNVFVDSENYKDDKQVDKTRWWATEYDEEIVFPLEAVKPELMDRANQAMTSKIFDEIGLVGDRSDPILVGAVVLKEGWHEKRLNFFLAWWVNKDAL